MNNMVYYLDSNDALFSGLNTSKDYAYCMLAQMSSLPSGECFSEDDPISALNEMIVRFVQNPESVSLFIADILYFRFMSSFVSVLAVPGDTMSLLINAAEQVYISMKREDIISILETSDVSAVESVLEKIAATIKALDEERSIMLISRIHKVRDSFLFKDQEAFFKIFPKSANEILSFAFYSGKKAMDAIISDNKSIGICNPGSYVLSSLTEVVPNVEVSSAIKSMNSFCVSICNIFSTIFSEGVVSCDLDEAYKSIWSFIVKTRATCFVPPTAYEKARSLLL